MFDRLAMSYLRSEHLGPSRARALEMGETLPGSARRRPRSAVETEASGAELATRLEISALGRRSA